MIKPAYCGNKQSRPRLCSEPMQHNPVRPFFLSKHTKFDFIFSILKEAIEYQVNSSGVSVPKELSHREAPFPQHRAEQLGQVQPDVGNVDGHVVRLLQRLCKPEETREAVRRQL